MGDVLLCTCPNIFRMASVILPSTFYGAHWKWAQVGERRVWRTGNRDRLTERERDRGRDRLTEGEAERERER